MNPMSMVEELARAIRDRLSPELGKQRSRDERGRAPDGDLTFRLDEIAEDLVDGYLRDKGQDILLFSEDRGLVQYGRKTRDLLMVDPVDGTRPAVRGLPLACTCVALVKLPDNREPAFGDVLEGCVLDLSDTFFFHAKRGEGVSAGGGASVSLTLNTDLDRLAWEFELAARPIQSVMRVLGPLVNRSSLRGGTFAFTSSSYSITRVVTGSLDAFVDVGHRVIEEIPGSLKELLRDSDLPGPVPCHSYDLAASYLVAKEVGVVITDTHGNDLDSYPLLSNGKATPVSCVAAGNAELHGKLIEYLENRFEMIQKGKA